MNPSSRRRAAIRRRFLVEPILLSLLSFLHSVTAGPFHSIVDHDWDRAIEWKPSNDGQSRVVIAEEKGLKGTALRLDFDLQGEHGWALIARKVTEPFSPTVPLTFMLRAKARGDLEIKLVDSNDSVFGRKVPLAGKYEAWTRVVVYLNNTEYWWGGNDDFDRLTRVELGLSGQGGGRVELDEIGFGPAGTQATFDPAGLLLDPDRMLAGVGFRQRRDAILAPEEPGVLAYLKQVQDLSSPAKAVLPSMENNELQTFNNALVAMAFMLKGERERAERILDYYAKATNRGNTDTSLQNFFFKGEPRGFFQHVNLHDEGGVKAGHQPGTSDRWMGDMAWLLIACKHHEQLFHSGKYAPLARLLQDLLARWYRQAPDGPGGYVQHGWRHGDQKLHEDHGHPEGNLDAYAAFRLCGDQRRADEIRLWLERVLKGKKLPLDLYTWRVLAFGREAAAILDIPEFDLRYRKTITANERKVTGFYSQADPKIENIWLDGTGHIACAYLLYGDPLRGNFYSNQLDALLFDRELGGVRTRALPYTANGTGGYEWVKTDRGFISVCAWYIFAKNRFNPLRLEQTPPRAF
jgi:hypothetical protein